MPVDVPADRVLRQIGIDDDTGLARGRGREEKQKGRKRSTEEPARASNQKLHLSFIFFEEGYWSLAMNDSQRLVK
jgi:hypothetical protein